MIYKKCVCKSWNLTEKDVDIFTIDNPEFEKHIPDIYPTELQLNKANTSEKETSFLHLWFAGIRECPPLCSIVGATVTVHQFFCILHFFHTCSLCRAELVVQFPARGST